MRYQILRTGQEEYRKGGLGFRRDRHTHKQCICCKLDKHCLAINEAIRSYARHNTSWNFHDDEILLASSLKIQNAQNTQYNYSSRPLLTQKNGTAPSLLIGEKWSDLVYDWFGGGV